LGDEGVNRQQSTVNRQQSTENSQQSTENSQPSTVNSQLSEIIKMADGQATPDAEVVLYHNFFSQPESQAFFQELLRGINWRHDKIKVYGKEFDQPRLTAWYGDEGKSYCYSGITMYPEAWTPTLIAIKSRIETTEQVKFNSVLLNLYRHGKDSMSWHSDDERELGKNPIIASVSFGETRRFLLRHKFDKSLPKVEIKLTNGSLLIMKGTTQHFWQHQIPKGGKFLQERINLTFRRIC
jgi:alkylated DNA repair dioxygenase AlkB